MSIAPIATAIRNAVPSASNAAVKEAVSLAARGAQGNVVTGQVASAAGTGFFATLAYLGQALKAPLVSLKTAAVDATGVVAKAGSAAAGESISIGTQTMAQPVITSSLLGYLGLGTVMVGDLVTAGSAGLAAYFLNSGVKVTTGTGIIGLTSRAVRSTWNGISGLFSRGTQAVQSGIKTVA